MVGYEVEVIYTLVRLCNEELYIGKNEISNKNFVPSRT